MITAEPRQAASKIFPDSGTAGAIAGVQVVWPAEAVWQAVSPLLPGFTVEVLPEIDSTNSELMRRARAGHLEPVLLVAERQTAGRGRLGRPWFSGHDDMSSGGSSRDTRNLAAGSTTALSSTSKQDGSLASLTFSLGLPLAPIDWSGLSLAVGTSLAESLHPRVLLKWPNDLWLADRKLAGILIETASFGGGREAGRYAVIGIGINIAARDAAGLSVPAAWLQEVLPEAQAGDVLLRIAAPLVRDVQAFETFSFAPFQARFNARDALRERTVVLSDGTAGSAHGTSETGALLVHTARGMNTVTSSEVSVRPI